MTCKTKIQVLQVIDLGLIFFLYRSIYSSSSCCFRARLLSGKFFFANQLVEGLGSIFGWCPFSHTRPFWPKGKKYILKNIKKNCAFYDFFRFFWVILGGFQFNFFWFDPYFLSYRTTKLQKSEFWWFSRHLNSMKKNFFCNFYIL